LAQTADRQTSETLIDMFVGKLGYSSDTETIKTHAKTTATKQMNYALVNKFM